MSKIFNRVKVNTATTSTGSVALGAAVSAAFFTFAEAGVSDGDVVSYVIEDGTNVEIGIGTISGSVGTMSRTVRLSKIGGTAGTSKINLSGSAVVYIAPAREDQLTEGASNTVAGNNAGALGPLLALTADQLATLIRTGTGTNGVLQSKVIHSTRDLSLTSGNVAYTGVGFKPTCLIGIAVVNATTTFAVGIVGNDKVGSTIDCYASNLMTHGAAFFQLQLADGSASKFQLADVASFDSDGFTLTWTKTGSPTGIADFYVMALR